MQHDVDLLILAENRTPTDLVLQALNPQQETYQTLRFTMCTKITVFTRFHPSFLRPTVESDRILICRLDLPGRAEILLAMAHLPSKANADEMSQVFECQQLSESVNEAETKAGHRRTIIVGDLNVNPFERAVVGAMGLHAVMAKNIALRNSRRVQNKEYCFFYNPMWRHFGERADGPPGSYYYGSAGHVSYFWNIFDQVLIRPELIKCFPDDELRILTSVGTVALLGRSGQPNTQLGSDHLPILFKLDI